MLIKCVIEITQSFKTAYDFLLIFFLLLDLNQSYEFKLTNPEANSKDTMISLETIFLLLHYINLAILCRFRCLC